MYYGNGLRNTPNLVNLLTTTQPHSQRAKTQVKFEGTKIKIYRNDELIQEFTLAKRLGQGAQGNVYHVIHELTNTHYAMKRVCVADMEGMEVARKEVEHVLQLQHDRIVPVHHLFEHVSTNDYGDEQYILYFTMDLYDYGDLSALIAEYKLGQRYFTQEQLFSTLFQISDALSYVHKKKLVHRDIKPQNIFVQSKSPIQIVVGDFGLSKMIESVSKRHSYVGSLNTMSPEIYMQTKYSFKVDIFSLGCIMFMMMTRNMARNIAWEINGCGQERTFSQLRAEILNTKQKYSKRLINIVLAMMSKDPNDRPTALQIRDFCQKALELEEKKDVPPPDTPPNTPSDSEIQTRISSDGGVRERAHSFSTKQGVRVIPTLEQNKGSKLASTATASGFAMLHMTSTPSETEINHSTSQTHYGTPSSVNTPDSPRSEPSRTPPPSPSHFDTEESVCLRVVHKRKSSLIDMITIDLFTKKPKRDDNTFYTLEDAITTASLYSRSRSVSICMSEGAFNLRENYAISQGNILVEGSPKKKTTIVGEKLLLEKTGVILRNLRFVNKNSSKPFILEITECDAVVEDCIIEGRILITGSSNSAPIIRGCEIYNNRKCFGTDTNGADIMAEDALIVCGSCPHVTANRIHDNQSNGIGIYMKGGGYYTENVISNHLKSESIGVYICEDSNPVFKSNIIHGNINGIYIANSKSILIDNCIHSNRRGVSLNFSHTILENNQIYCHEQTAICMANYSSVKASDNILRANNGIAIYVDSSHAEIEYNQIEDNYDDQYASICVLGPKASVVVKNNTILGNAGGGIFVRDCSAIIENNEFKENRIFAVKSMNSQTKIVSNEIAGQSDCCLVIEEGRAQTTLLKNRIVDHSSPLYPSITIAGKSLGIHLAGNEIERGSDTGILVCQESTVTKFLDNVVDVNNVGLTVYESQGAIVCCNPADLSNEETYNNEQLICSQNTFKNAQKPIEIVREES